MDKLSIVNNFSPVFTDVSSTEKNFSRIDVEQAVYPDFAYTLSNDKPFACKTPLEKPYNLFLKRFLDILCSLLLIILIFPWLLPILAILIKSDSKGPVFFLQRRNKHGGRYFTCIKFRSMVLNKDADIIPAGEDDKRITRCGKYLRRYHIDELPQLFNVLLGDMSVIGPRPHMVSENIAYEKLVKEYGYRHAVKPGITGLAQSLGNFGASGDLEKVEQRVALDIEYIKSWSVSMDMKIMYRTCRLMFRL